MASSSQLFVSSSPTPHHLNPFRHFAPQPSPLGHATNLYDRSGLPVPENSFDFDEEHSLEYDHEHEEGDEEDEEHHASGAEEEDEEEELEDDDESQAGEQGSMSPSLDVSFASSMSIGTAPPTPCLNANRRRQQRPLGQPTPPPANRRVNHPVASTSAFLPAHLFAPTPNAHPPSSSPCRMDISPPPTSRLPPPTLAAQFFNPPKSSISSDPFAIQNRSGNVLSSSPPTDRPTIGLKKTKSRSRMISGFFEPRPDSQPFATSDEDSDRMGSDGMEIDSPGYAQRTRNIFQPLVVVDDSNQPVQRAPRSGRSGSQGSIGKRSRSDEDEDEDGPLSARSSLGSEMQSIQMNHPRTRSDDGHSSSRHHLSPAQPHSGSGRTRTMPETACQFLVSESSSRTSSGFQLPSSPAGSASDARFRDPSMSSSPCQMMSPSVKAAAKLTLGRKAGERSLSGFRFPVTKASTGAQVHVRAGSSGSTNVRNLSFQPSAGGSLGASTLAGFPRRPALGVVQSAATLFSRHTTNTVPTVSSVESEAPGMGSLRQRDAVGRPASKSRRAISFAATEGHTLMSGVGDDDEEDEEEDGLAGLNCSPAPRGVSHTWPKFGPSSAGHTRIASETVVGAVQPARKRSPPPPPLNSLAPPTRGPFENMLQSPSRLSPHQQKAIFIARTIESPVGMGFSEKERAGKILPCHKVSDDGLMRISPKTLDELLDGRYDRAISKKIVIDCRFKYEYEGGHIKDAINVREKEHIEEVLLSATSMGLLSPPEPSESGKCDGSGLLKKVVLVFHCEYSAMRAPTIAKHLREKDRHLNMPHYPALHYPEVYILEGGYAKYHAHSPQNCDGDYVPMDDPLHRFDRHADLNMFRSKESARFVKKKSSKKVIRSSTATSDENVSTSVVIEEECSPCKKEDNSTTRKAVGGPMRRIDSNSLRVMDERRR